MLIVCPSCAAEYMLADDKIGPEGRRVRCSSCRWVFEVQPPEPESAGPEQAEPVAFEAMEDAFAEAPPLPASRETAALIDNEWTQAALQESEVAAALASGSQPALTEDQGITDFPPSEPPPPMPRHVAKPVARPSLLARLMALAAVPLNLMATPAGIAALSFAIIGYGIWQRDRVVMAVPSLSGVYELVGLPANIRGLKVEAVRSELATDGQTRFMVVEGRIISLKAERVTVPQIELVVRDAQKKPLYTWSLEPPRPTLIPGDEMKFRARLASPPEQSHDVVVRFSQGGAKTAPVPAGKAGGKSAASTGASAPISITVAR